MVLGEKKGYKLKEIPIEWIERGGSKVKLAHTTKDYLKRLFYFRKRLKKMGL
jgi:hypothetical protein